MFYLNRFDLKFLDKGSDQSKSQIMPLSGGSTTQLTRSPRFIDLSMGDIPP